jgi:hypothetical protein
VAQRGVVKDHPNLFVPRNVLQRLKLLRKSLHRILFIFRVVGARDTVKTPIERGLPSSGPSGQLGTFRWVRGGACNFEASQKVID